MNYTETAPSGPILTLENTQNCGREESNLHDLAITRT